MTGDPAIVETKLSGTGCSTTANRSRHRPGHRRENSDDTEDEAAMTVVIEHVRHRFSHDDETHDRLAWTHCGLRFAHGDNPRDLAHHMPARRRCRGCYA